MRGVAVAGLFGLCVDMWACVGQVWVACHRELWRDFDRLGRMRLAEGPFVEVVRPGRRVSETGEPSRKV